MRAQIRVVALGVEKKVGTGFRRYHWRTYASLHVGILLSEERKYLSIAGNSVDSGDINQDKKHE